MEPRFPPLNGVCPVCQLIGHLPDYDIYYCRGWVTAIGRDGRREAYDPPGTAEIVDHFQAFGRAMLPKKAPSPKTFAELNESAVDGW